MDDHFIIPLVHGPEGSGPAMPPDVFGWAEIAAPAHPAPWALYRCMRDPDLPLPATWLPIPSSLQYALWSGYAYPPSLAIMAELLPATLAALPLSLDTFVTTVIQLLRHAQANQRQHGFCLAESLVDQAGYLTPGVFYWITGYYPSHDIVQWVSGDAILYYEPRQSFDIDQSALAHLQRSPERPWMIPVERVPV